MDPWKQANRYLEIGFIFPSCVVVGLLLGYWLDRLTGKSVFQLPGLLLGIAAGFVQFIRIASKKKNDEK